MIKFEDLRTGDIATVKWDGFEMTGPVDIGGWGMPYFPLPNGTTINIKEHWFVSAVRHKELPTLPGSVINNVVEYDGWRGGLMVLDNDGNWHSSDHAVRPEHIVEWEEV